MLGFVTAATFGAAVFSQVASAAFREGCASAPWDSDTDFWLTKFDNLDDRSGPTPPIQINYENTFAYIKNKQKRHIVIHCSDERPPTSIVGENALFVKAPVESVAALDPQSQAFIAMLGMSETIKRVGDDYDDVRNACVRGNMLQNITADPRDTERVEEFAEVDVTFHDDASKIDELDTVLVRSGGAQAPLDKLSWIKFFSMFYGLEETAQGIFDEIANDYRCVAANVHQMKQDGEWPEVGPMSAVGMRDYIYYIEQGDYWGVLASDAGSSLVNISDSAWDRFEPHAWSRHSTNGIANSEVATDSWAFIDTAMTPRNNVTQDTWIQDVRFTPEAARNDRLYRADYATNRAQEADFWSTGQTRPDWVLRDLVHIFNPEFDPTWETKYIRNMHDETNRPQRRFAHTCSTVDNAVSNLDVSTCSPPEDYTLNNQVGVTANAYDGSSSGSGLSIGAIAGIVVGVVVACVLLGFGIGFLVFRKRRSSKAAAARADAHSETSSQASFEKPTMTQV